MGKAARAIVVYGNKILVMRRNKQGNDYYTLVGGRVNENEDLDQALKREVYEETGLQVTSSQLVYVEKHREPYNEQYIYLCQLASYNEARLQDWSEEGKMNRLDMNVHTPGWVQISTFAILPFRTPQVQNAIVNALKEGFPNTPVEL